MDRYHAAHPLNLGTGQASVASFNDLAQVVVHPYPMQAQVKLATIAANKK